MMLTELLSNFGRHVELIDEAFEVWLDRRFVKMADGGLLESPIHPDKIAGLAQRHKISQRDIRALFQHLDLLDSEIAEKYCNLLDMLRAGAADAGISLTQYWAEYSAGFELGLGPGYA